MESLGFDIIHQTPWSSLLLGIVAIFAGAIVQGSTGLGLGMIAAPILLIIDPVFVPGPLLMLAMIVSFLMVIREKQSIDGPGLTVALSGRIPGTILAAFTIAAIPLALYGLIFGLMVLAAVVLSISKWKIRSSGKNLFLAGLTSGYMGTLTSIGAPPMALAYQYKPAAVIRSTLAAYFLIGSTLSIITLIIFKVFLLDHLLVGAIFVPPLLIGFKMSSYVVARMNTSLVRIAILILSGISALTLIARSIYAFL